MRRQSERQKQGRSESLKGVTSPTLVICETTANRPNSNTESVEPLEIQLNLVTLGNNELKPYIHTDELQNTVSYLDCHGQNFIFNDTRKNIFNSLLSEFIHILVLCSSPLPILHLKSRVIQDR